MSDKGSESGSEVVGKYGRAESRREGRGRGVRGSVSGMESVKECFWELLVFLECHNNLGLPFLKWMYRSLQDTFLTPIS